MSAELSSKLSYLWSKSPVVAAMSADWSITVVSMTPKGVLQRPECRLHQSMLAN